MTVAGLRVGSVLEEHLDGPQEARPGRVVQRRRVERPDAGRTVRIAGTTVVRAGPVLQEGADELRIILAALVPGAAGPDPRASDP